MKFLKKLFSNKSIDTSKYDNLDIIKSNINTCNNKAIVCTNSRNILDIYVNKYQTFAFENTLKMITSYYYNILLNIFGKENLKFKGLEYTYKVYIFEYGEFIFELFTSNGYGTSINFYNKNIEININDVINGKYDNVILSFSNKLFNLINNLDN